MFVNLMLNAFQAMSGAGVIRISSTVSAEGGVTIVFADSGPGVEPEIADRIFDPFFTTRDVGEGTGLGLSMVAGIVQEHGGSIALDRECATGARFIIRLPAAAGKQRPEHPQPFQEDQHEQ